MSDRKAFEYKQYLFLGSRVSAQHPLFQKLAKLGYEEAEVYSFFEWLKYLGEHPTVSFEEGILTLIEFQGMAHFLPTCRDIVTRLSMILGDTRKSVDWYE